MAKKDEILFEWTVPQRIIRRDADRLLKRGKKIAPRLIIFTIIILTCTYFFVKDLPPPQNRSWEMNFLLTLLVIISLVLYVSYIGPWLMKKLKSSYQITSKGILYKGVQSKHLWTWKNIQGYNIDQDEETNSSVLTLIIKTFKRKIYLADEEDSVGRVINLIGEKVPYIEKEELESNPQNILTKRDYIFLASSTCIYIICYTWFLFSFRPKGNLGYIFLALPLILGPGTLGCLARFGKRTFKNARLHAIILSINMLAFVIIMLLMVILLLIKYTREANA